MAKPSVFPIKPEDVDKVWDGLRGYIEESMEYGLRTHALEDVRTAVKKGSFVLWAVINAEGKRCGAAVTAIETHPLVKIGVVWWLGGCGIDEWFETSHKVLASWARMNSCGVLRHAGRKGWVKILEPYGYESVGHVCLLRLQNEHANQRAETCPVVVDKPQQVPSPLGLNMTSY